MKSVLLVVLLAAAASAAVVGNEVPDVAELPAVPDMDVNVNEMPEVFVTDAHDLADVADLTDGAEDTAVSSRWSLIQGTIGSSDVRVYNGEHRANGVAGHVTTRDITIRTSRRITAIRVIRLGASQNAMPSIVSGGVGTSAVTIRIRSAVGRGFHYSVQVYGR